MLVRLR